MNLAKRILFIFIVSISPTLGSASGLSPEDTNKVLGIFQNSYGDVQFILNQDAPEANAQAIQFFGSKAILVEGGLLKIDDMTKDIFSLILCHELGHHYGGPPYFAASEGNAPWASAEGMADFWAARNCLPNILKELPPPTEDLNLETALFCLTQADKINYSNCTRTLNASIFIARLQARARQDVDLPRLSSSENIKVEKTLISYPTAQCRLDTFVAGVLQKGTPPRCWYSEKN